MKEIEVKVINYMEDITAEAVEKGIRLGSKGYVHTYGIEVDSEEALLVAKEELSDEVLQAIEDTGEVIEVGQEEGFYELPQAGIKLIFD